MRNILIGLAIAGLFLASCSKPGAETHSNTGVVESVEMEKKTVTIRHPAFTDGFMEGMTMPYEVVDGALLDGLKKGDKIAFTVTKQEEFYPITDIKKLP